MSNRLKPIPRNQSEVVQSTITPYPLANLGKPVSETVFSKNRGTDYSLKNDTVKNISIGLEDIDRAILYYLQNIIKPTVVQNGQQIAVPVIYGSPERWKAVQADGFYRDMNGALQLPLIMFKRDSFEKNRTLGNKLDGNTAHLYQVVGTKYNSRNAYDAFDILNNRAPSEQYYITTPPDYITLTYNCIVFTNFFEQNNKVVEAIEFASDSYWGEPNRWKFRVTIDSFTTNTLLENTTERAARSTFNFKVYGYIIPNSVNKDMATARNKFYTNSQIIFDLETSVNLKSPTKEVFVLSATGIGANEGSEGGGPLAPPEIDIARYENTFVTATATTITVNNEAIFPYGFLPAPDSLPPTSKNNFTYTVNGNDVDLSYITNFVDNGDGTSTLTIDYSWGTLDGNDIVVAVGKFQV